MEHAFLDHITGDRLEQYALGRLGDSDCDDVGNHLLRCSECRRRLTDIGDFVAGVREAAEALAADPPRKRIVFYRQFFRLPALLLLAFSAAWR